MHVVIGYKRLSVLEDLLANGVVEILHRHGMDGHI
jgi:hypothetical protein